MKAQNMTDAPDAKIYELGLRILIDHLGVDGITRFLGICKPRKTDINAGVQRLSHAEMEKIQEEVYRTYRTQPFVPHRDFSQMSDMDFYKLGLNTVSDQMGPVGMTRFIRIRRPGTDDYTAERHKWLDKLDRNTILEGIQQIQQKYLAARTKNKK